LWVPSGWDAQLIVAHEPVVLRELERTIRPGSTIYDIGANVGLFSLRFARWIGPAGWLYAIEPNPVCVYFLRANLDNAGVRNFTIVPVAVSGVRGGCDFVLSYGSSLIGVGSDSPYASKPGHAIRVEADALDRLIVSLNLRPPDFIKLDVEGAEASAVVGMMNIIEDRRPGLMIELHGRESAVRTLRLLAPFGYQYFLSSASERFRTAEDVLEAMPDACVQVIGYP
jgi:FkbM family methyltransferase